MQLLALIYAAACVFVLGFIAGIGMARADNSVVPVRHATARRLREACDEHWREN